MWTFVGQLEDLKKSCKGLIKWKYLFRPGLVSIIGGNISCLQTGTNTPFALSDHSSDHFYSHLQIYENLLLSTQKSYSVNDILPDKLGWSFLEDNAISEISEL